MDHIPWTAEETSTLLDLVIYKKLDWDLISQKIAKPVQSCQYWYHFLQNTSKTIYPHYLSSLILPTDIWPRVAINLNIHDILSLVTVNQAIHNSVLAYDFVWQKALVEMFPFYGYLKDENVSFLGKNPYLTLLRKLMFGKFLVITNADYYWKSVAMELLSAGWKPNNMDMITISESINLENIESTKYDAVVVITNYGWPDNCFDELGNIIKK